MYRAHLNSSVIEIEEIDRKRFDSIVSQMAEGSASLDRFPTPPIEHRCVGCPIDPHTMRRVVRLLADIRNSRLRRFEDTPDDKPFEAVVELLAVNTLDLAIGYLCGGLAPELAVKLRENYVE